MAVAFDRRPKRCYNGEKRYRRRDGTRNTAIAMTTSTFGRRIDWRNGRGCGGRQSTETRKTVPREITPRRGVTTAGESCRRPRESTVSVIPLSPVAVLPPFRLCYRRYSLSSRRRPGGCRGVGRQNGSARGHETKRRTDSERTQSDTTKTMRRS